MSANDTTIGRRLPHFDAMDKATGRATYIDDMSRPKMLHAAMAFSPYAHARILGCDTKAARELDGVKAVLTGEDFKAIKGGPFIKDEPAIATDKVRYFGEPVAVVAAIDKATARQAAQLIEVEYEPLSAILSIDDALDHEKPMIHEDFTSYERLKPAASNGNILWETEISHGNPDDIWEECDVIVEGEFQTQAQHHVYMEPCGALAEPSQDGRLTIWSSCQSVHLVQEKVAYWLDIPMSKIRAMVPNVGGAFGAKGSLHVQHLVAKLALETGMPVKLTLSRTEDFEIVRSRHPMRIHMRTGAKNDGTLIARQAEIILDGGAYTDESPAVLSMAVIMSRGPYNIHHVRSSGKLVYTNKLKAGPYRGFGNPQVTFASETQIDEIAHKLNMDPVALRLKNSLGAGDRFFGGQILGSSGLKECLINLRNSVENSRKTVSGEKSLKHKKRGVGYAALSHSSGILSTSAQVHLRADGSIAIVTGVVDIGQGSSMVLTQIVANVFSLPLDKLSFSLPDSDTSPYNWKTAASRTTYMSGRAVLSAANKVRNKLFKAASEMLECTDGDLELRPGGWIGVKGSPEVQLSFAQIAGYSNYIAGAPISGSDAFVFDGPDFDQEYASVKDVAIPKVGLYVFGAQAAEVEVDTRTGKVDVLRVWSAHDVGRAINPTMVEGQIQGAVVQGLGYALTEEMIWDDDGRLANPSLMDYKIPGILDVPDLIDPIIVEEPEPTGPYGAKGVAECGIVGIAPAVANAIFDAVGIRLRQLPFSPEVVFSLLKE